MTFKDHFSAQAELYARYRPTYPRSFFGKLAALAPETDRALDCATGSGQAAVSLAVEFNEVVAVDASEEQLRHAAQHPRVRYLRARAEETGLDAGSIDLVVVAQALHWLDLDAFYAEARRVGKPGAAIVVWCCQLVEITPEIDALVRRLHSDIVGDYWPPERAHVDDGYVNLPFPFDRLELDRPEVVAEWRLADLLGYLSTWSSVTRYKSAHGRDPVTDLEAELAAAWGDRATTRSARWPTPIFAGRISAVG